MRRRLDRATVVGLGLVVGAAVAYWLGARGFDAGRDDFFYLADAFLHGRTWVEAAPVGPYDIITIGGRNYVPFAPFPAIVFLPLVAIVGPETADRLGSEINSLLAAGSVGLAWMLLGRLGVTRLAHRFWLVILFGFSTALWWVTTRGGVWHTGQIIATILTLGCLLELWGRQRAVLIGLLAGAAFLTRAPLAFALPFYLLLLNPTGERTAGDQVGNWFRTARDQWPVGDWIALGATFASAVFLFFFYNYMRFGNFFESGYALAALPDWLEARRQLGLFSPAHVGWNLELMLFHLPQQIPEFPYFKPDGLGMSVLLTSPGLLLALRAPWREPRTWWLLGAAIAVLIPTLLYYGGGWLQYGYRYFLDSVPFIVALCGLAVARRGMRWIWIVVILFGVVVGLGGVYWVDKI